MQPTNFLQRITRQDETMRDNLALALWVISTFLAILLGSHSSVFLGVLAAAVLYILVWWFLQREN